MSMTILVGQVATADGAAIQDSYSPTRYGFERQRTIYSCPATEYRSEQPDTIAVDIDHEGPAIGTVAYLAQRGHGLFAVLDVDADLLPEPPWYLSAELEGRYDGTGYHDVTLHRVAVVERSATVAKSPAVAVVGNLDDAFLYHANGHNRSLLKEAAEYAKGRRFCRRPHLIAPDPSIPVARPATITTVSRDRPRLELRSAATGDVRPAGRSITLVAIPHETETTIVEGGRVIKEICSRGAFAGEESTTRRIHVNRDHNLERLVGKVRHLDPYAERGVIAELRIAPTVLGDETLALAADDCLDASVGFGILGETWDAGHTRRRIDKAFLDHIALVPLPAYQTANVLDVRSYR